DGFARKVPPAGDVNVDGVLDVLIGAPYATVGGKDRAGEAYVLFGDRAFPPDVFLSKGFAGQRILGEDSLGLLGWIVGSAGDLTADGVPDILVGARAISFDPPLPGRAYVIYGIGSAEPPFTIFGMDTASGPERGGTAVTIQGSGFRSGVAVF